MPVKAIIKLPEPINGEEFARHYFFMDKLTTSLKGIQAAFSYYCASLQTDDGEVQMSLEVDGNPSVPMVVVEFVLSTPLNAKNLRRTIESFGGEDGTSYSNSFLKKNLFIVRDNT